ncbi:MAG: HAD family hydrolase [bacterium]|nr:HAD family hydrolase [bacterium]
MHITTISFDGDMTFWDFQKVMRHSLKHTLAELRRQIPTPTAMCLTVDEMIDIRNKVAEEVKGKISNLEEIRQLAFERTLEHIGSPNNNLAAHLNAIYLKHRFEDIELYEDVLPALDILSSHFKIGLLSNGNSYPERCGLQDRFAFVVFSQDAGTEKPHKMIFEITAEQAGCRLDQLLHVGDSLKNDVAGAAGAGARSVWLNRNNQMNNTEIKPDYEVTSLTEIPAILGVD